MKRFLFLIEILLLVTLLSIPLTVMARNLGVHGQTYPILEQDFLEWIQARLTTLQQQGQLHILQQQWVKEVAKHADRPTPVAGITTTSVPRTWSWNPSIQVSTSIQDPNGAVLIPAGTIVNPLNLISLRHDLVFYNGDDPKQVQWAQKIDTQQKGEEKLILVQGSLSSQLMIFKKLIYFDQQGRLTRRFHIQHVPAIVTQEGLHLRVREVPV
jgi:conjugal transfer pilus assembly protein TraW